ARDRHAFRVAAESGDVPLHPLERRVLVEQRVVAGRLVRALLGQLRMREQTEDAEPIVQGHRDDALLRHAGAVITGLGTVARDETAAVDIDENRELFGSALRRCPYVQVEAVFADAVRAKDHVVEDAPLHALRAELGRLALALPILHRLRLAPAQIPDRRLREWNAFEDAEVLLFVDDADERAVRDLHARRIRRGEYRGTECERGDQERAASERSEHETSPCRFHYWNEVGD